MVKVEVVITNESKGFTYYKEIQDWDIENPREAYKLALKEYGKCTSKIYIDTDKGAHHVGWHFQKKEQYKDTKEKFLQGAWITPVEVIPKKVIPLL